MAVRKRKLQEQSAAKAADAGTAGKVEDEPNVRTSSRGRNHKLTLLSSAGIAVLLAALQYHLLFTMFENDRYFSYLSELEREMSFRTEMGLYYSYYKTIVSAPTFLVGVSLITADNVTEYPSVINTLQRFNLVPEVVVGGAYRLYRAVATTWGVLDRRCFTVNRGEGIPSVEACEGLGEPVYFYMTAVFALNGCYLAVVFLLAMYLSGGSYLGGLLGAFAFVCNLTEITRVMWTPPLRESFATPFLFLQLLTLSYIIRNQRTGAKWAAILSAPTLAFLLPWQFAQFVMVMQCLIVGTMAAFNLLYVGVFRTVIAGVSLAYVANVALQYGNTMLVTSYLPATLAASWLAILVQTSGLLRCLPFPVLAGVMQTAVYLATIAGVKAALWAATGQEDDAHIGGILVAKFTGYTDFHTQMYLCAREYDFMELELPVSLSLTLLLPVAVLAVVLVTRKVLPVAWRQLWQWNSTQDATTVAMAAESSYHLLQLLAFTMLAVLVMRLKLFFTPYLCLFMGWTASEKLVDGLGRRWHVLLVLILIGCSSWQGSQNIRNMMSIEGEFNDLPQEEMLNWIKFKTPQNAVFAGAMPIMATVKLSTGRAIVNHPHYEHREVRERTQKVYQLYSRKPAEEIHRTLQEMGVTLAVVEGYWCHWRTQRPGCTFGEVWDMVDPAHMGKPQFCEDVLADNGQLTPPPFKLVFKNTHYSILSLQ